MGSGPTEGVHFNIPGAATSRSDQMDRAMLDPFQLADAIPLPEAICGAPPPIPAISPNINIPAISDF